MATSPKHPPHSKNLDSGRQIEAMALQIASMATLSGSPNQQNPDQKETEALRVAALQALLQYERCILKAALTVAQACLCCHVLRRNLLPDGLRAGHSQALRTLIRVAETGTKEEVASLLSALLRTE